jgi:hypothetical protein
MTSTAVLKRSDDFRDPPGQAVIVGTMVKVPAQCFESNQNHYSK